jgi:hypothetical protein
MRSGISGEWDFLCFFCIYTHKSLEKANIPGYDQTTCIIAKKNDIVMAGHQCWMDDCPARAENNML